MGLAIWSMHFVGMLAFHIDTPLAYDIPLTGLSIIYAMGATTAALLVVSSQYRNLFTQLTATFFMGSGVAAMHYTGMEALQMEPAIIYDRSLFALSLLVAYLASFVAMRFFFSEADDPVESHRLYSRKRFNAALLMGIAIAGMHYTAMEAAIFLPGTVCGAVGQGIDSGIMSLLIVLGVILILSSTLLLLMLDTKYEDNKRLRQSEQRVRDVINSAPQGMLVTDEQGVIIKANRSIESMFKYSVEELVGKTVDLLLPVPLREKHKIHRGEYAKNPTSRAMGGNKQLLASRKDGSEFPVEVGLSPIISSDQPLFLATVVDITERQKLEKELDNKRKDLEEANQLMEQRIIARTQELREKNEELSEAMDILERARDELVQSEKLASLGSIVAGVAHEMNTPIGIVVTASSTINTEISHFRKKLEGNKISKRDLNNFMDTTESGMELILKNSERAGSLIRSFKDVAVDQTSQRRRDFNLKIVIDEIIDTLHPKIKRTPYQVVVEIPENINLDSYPGPLGQVITNLIINALTHAFESRDEGVINISAERLSDDMTELRVQDNGCGIPPENLPRVFDPFFTTRLGKGGSGLGMNIVYTQTTQVLGGNINIDSSSEKGTLIKLELPLVAPFHENENDLNE